MNRFRKAELYILSLAVLFVFILIITIDVPLCMGKDCTVVGIWDTILGNVVPIVCLIFLVLCLLFFLRFRKKLNSATELPFELTEVKQVNYEHLTFLATYVVPLISFDFDSGRQMFVLFLLLVIMGVIYIKTDLFYANPSLALFGFQIFEGKGNFKNTTRNNDSHVFISRKKLTVGDKLLFMELDDRILYVKKTNNG